MTIDARARTAGGLLLAALLLAAAWPLAGAGDDAPATELAAGAEEGAEGDLFIETVDVNLVNVEVYVTDRDGNRVTDLTVDDFELYEDGKPVQITNFYTVEGGRTAGREDPAVAALPLSRDRLLEEEPASQVPEDQRLHLIVYIDNYNLHPFTRNRTIGAVRTFLRNRLSSGDRVMLVTYDRSLHLRHPFTSDPELIASALYELEDISAHAVHADSDRRTILEAIFEAEDLLSIHGRAVQHAESVYNDLSFTISALRDYVDTLAGLPGRKAILYVSDGLAMRAAEDVFYALEDRFRESSVLMDIHRFDASRDFQQLTALANANRVTFYTIDAAGLRTYTYMDAANATPLGGPRIDQVHFQNIQSPLIMMAEETGGLVIMNTNSVGPKLERIAEDFNTYYSLGYSPAHSGTGRYYRLEVKLKDKRKGWQVRHREGYRDKPVHTRMTDSTLAALHFGYQQNPMDVRLELGRVEPAPDEDDRYVVTLLLKIPLDNVSFLPQAEMHRAKLRLYVAAKDTDGGLAPVQELPLPIDIPAGDFESLRGQHYQYQMQLLMRGGSQVVAVGVRDDIGAQTAVVARGLTVGERRG